jgi:hypothetical protein
MWGVLGLAKYEQGCDWWDGKMGKYCAAVTHKDMLLEEAAHRFTDQ